MMNVPKAFISAIFYVFYSYPLYQLSDFHFYLPCPRVLHHPLESGAGFLIARDALVGIDARKLVHGVCGYHLPVVLLLVLQRAFLLRAVR